MVLTLLIDLDDTLLGNAMEVFIPVYLEALGRHLADEIPPKIMVASMLDSTQMMFSNENPAQTLKETFDLHFFPSIGIAETSLRTQIEDFYNTSFSSLQKYTQYRPTALQFINTAINRGYRIGIATNPVFPKTAIVQRLNWAGFPEDEFHFALVPSYETFHFAKPDPAYFAEFLTRLGWPEGPILMVGNDLEHDIMGSGLLGIPSFWINKTGQSSPTNSHEPSGRGDLDDVHPWLAGRNLDELIPDFNKPTAMKAILRGVPAGLSTILTDVGLGKWSFQPENNGWSLTEILCHLRDVEMEVNLPRIRLIMKEDSPFIPGIDSDKWAKEREYIDQDGPEAFSGFLETRMETLEILKRLEEKDWEREIRHSIFGSTDLKEIVHIMALHDILHVRQIVEITRLFLPAK